MLPLFFLFFVLPTDIQAEEIIKVRLVNYVGDPTKITLEMKGDYVSLDPTLTLIEGVKYALFVDNDHLTLVGGGDTQIIVDSLVLVPRTYNEQHQILVNDRPYLGAIEFKIEQDHIRPINQLPLEDYLKGVVPFEVYPSWGIETLKAQAIAARTYAVTQLKQNIDDTIQFQVYGGFDWKPNTSKAVDETKGEIITYHNKPIEAFYSASNGGKTESNAHVWGGKSISYYPIKDDPYDPTHPWEFVLHKHQLDLESINWDHQQMWESLQEKDKQITTTMKRWLNKNGYVGEIKIISIPTFTVSDNRLNSKRATHGSLTIEFLQQLIEGTVLYNQLTLHNVKLNKIRPIIGGTVFKSYFIESLSETNGVYTMNGNGYGHGVGMSQWGANTMGLKGKPYKDILQFYFPGTEIKHTSELGKQETREGS
ncbi:SpoIID/LytB domain-containing protein [Bacillus salitolerans]|uniref:SpoIID/LytB domain-containing protein n=1 Tax=Bacillus salitolerans TaxID=1437434 RepID=A0ABW4LQJ4_9BACI